ncbi:MAG: maleylpyruvate isomerase family mycothiol-dependent enzyme [Anaerolineae bacterium]
MSLDPLVPVNTVSLFPGLSEALLGLLRELSASDWAKPTACADWSVKDVVAHLLGGNLGRLSHQRDRLQREPAAPWTTAAELTALINAQNEAWVRAACGISSPILLDFLERTDAELHTFFKSLPPDAPSPIGVMWAGEAASANWFDIGREYTEKWFHQQHIREAVGATELTERRWLRPVIDICLRALPYTYRDIEAAEGTLIAVHITGRAGGTWTLVRESASWTLYQGTRDEAVTAITMTDDTAWRLFSRGLRPDQVRRRIGFAGSVALGRPIWDLISIMA